MNTPVKFTESLKTTPFFVSLDKVTDLLHFTTPVSGYHREVMVRFLSETLSVDADAIESEIYESSHHSFISYSTTGALLITLLAKVTKTAQKAKHVYERLENGAKLIASELCPELAERHDAEELEREIYSIWVLYIRTILSALPVDEMTDSVYRPDEIYNYA